MQRTPVTNRRGAVLVLLLVSIITLFSFVALAIDLGMLAVARTQLQDATDVAAMAGARKLNGDTASNNNYSLAAPSAVTAATANSVLSKPITAADVNVQVGRYVYVPGNQRFEGQIPGPSDENWSLVVSQVSSNTTTNLAFAKVFNLGSSNMQASATAIHRPRDVAVILDYSGSMRFASATGLPFSSGARTDSNNPDTVFPQHGHYASISSELQATSFTSPYDAANITTTTSDGRQPIVSDFYTNATGSTAFTAAPSSYATTPNGDKHARKNNNNASAAFCTNVADLLNITAANNNPKNAFETNGYNGISGYGTFQGFTQGPGYWGKTFFLWPPDPRPANDWRLKFFNTNDNTVLFDSSGNFKKPTTIRYDQILAWIKQTPCPFPSRLQSGRILYYDQIPSSISATYPPSNQNERFWKDYIDYVFGLMQSGSSTWNDISDRVGYGPETTFGTIKITSPSSLTANPKPYMHYGDNPKRPLTHFWFGPLTMVDFLGNYNMWYHSAVTPSCSRYCWWPGTCHETPMYGCKLGIRAALTDIQTNHPNNIVAMMMFSHPDASVNADGRFNRPRVGLGRNYARMQEALWYPPSTLGNTSATIRPYDTENGEVPRAMGGTCYSMGLMQAYNQFSTNTSALLNYNPAEPAGDAGGNGRRGAQKVVIFETDGAPNYTASASLVNSGAHNSYYRIRYNSANPSASEFPTGVASYSNNNSTVTTQIFSLCSQLSALETASPPGYSTPSKKVQIHCIGFGPVFAPGSSERAAALATLNQMQILGNVNDGMPDYKVIYGTEAQLVSKLQQAFTQILQNGVQVALVQ